LPPFDGTAATVANMGDHGGNLAKQTRGCTPNSVGLTLRGAGLVDRDNEPTSSPFKRGVNQSQTCLPRSRWFCSIPA
jgi:hypothetical protein